MSMSTATPACTAQTFKPLIVCADDFAIHAAASDAILALLATNRLSVTSCMTDSPRWEEDGKRLCLLGMASRAGLHFNLTEAFPDYPATPLATLMLKARFGRLAKHDVQQALNRQLDRFEAVMGTAPAFIDGHQHVHIFPTVREVMADVIAARYGNRPWVRQLDRLVEPCPADKRIALSIMGRQRHADGNRARHVVSNTGFGGVYGLQADGQFEAGLPRWLAGLPSMGMMMCHPAAATIPHDVIGPARFREYQFLSSEAWPAYLRAANVQLIDRPDGFMLGPVLP